MRTNARLSQDEATSAQIAEHLRRCDGDFNPPLSDRVDLDVYAEKISAFATRYEAWSGATLIGLVAVYANDPTAERAFVTSVSVVREHQGQGLATRLMARAIDGTRRRGFRRLELEVGRGNTAAIRLYTDTGFAMVCEEDQMVRMNLELQVSRRTENEP
jgi:ribosomal protein S18 acetylase RimI-like enzyme